MNCQLLDGGNEVALVVNGYCVAKIKADGKLHLSGLIDSKNTGLQTTGQRNHVVTELD